MLSFETNLTSRPPVFKRALAIVLCLIFSGLPAIAADQTAGRINALIPAATRNSQPTKVKDDLQWNDLLQTTQSGRVRAGLLDGSILSLGSNSQLKVLQHDAKSQQTSLEMDYGKLRNKVVKITQPGGKYEVKTPNAVIGVLGTDFYVGYENNLTTVICYKGTVSVIMQGGSKVVKKSDQAPSNQHQVNLGEGQMAVIGTEIPPAGFPPESEIIHASMVDTNVPVTALVAAPKFWIPVVAGVVGGGIAGGIAATRSSGSPAIPPAVTCGAVGRIKCAK